MFVNELVLISEQITEYMFGALTENNDKFSSKLNIFRYLILQCWHKILENFITIMHDFEKHSG